MNILPASAKATDFNHSIGEYMPYKGLMPYEEADASFFFGRENWRDIIINNLRASRLTILYGSSGVGKSSVLRAEVIHYLRKIARQNQELYGVPKIAVVIFNAWRDNPLTQLRQQIEETIQTYLEPLEKPSISSSLPFDQALMEWSQELGDDTGEGKLFIILDQFEEYFLYHRQESEAGTFAVEFPKAVNCPDLPVNFLISLREDSLSKLDRFKEAIPNLLGNLLRLEHLDEDAASDAIRKPVREYNRQYRLNQPELPSISVEPALVQAVLDQVKTGAVALAEKGRGGIEIGTETLAEKPIEAPFLQMVMTRLWWEEMGMGSHRLRAKTLEQLGGATQIVKEHLDAQMNDLTANEQNAAAHIFNYLVTPSGTKISQTVDDLVRYVNEEGDGSVRLERSQVESLLENLSQGDARILRPVPPTSHTDPRDRYEIFHDVLADAILDWRRRYLEAQKLEIERAKLEEAQRQETERLQVAVEKQRIEADKKRTRIEKKWVRISGIGSLCAIGVVFALFGWLQVKEQKNTITRLNLAGSQALVQLETGDNLTALQSAMELGQTVQDQNFAEKVPAATLALQQILDQIPEKNRWLFTEGIPNQNGINQSANGQWLMLGLMDGRIYRWQVGQGTWQQVSLTMNDAVVSLDVSNDGQRMVAATANGSIKVWDAKNANSYDFSLKKPVDRFVRVRLSPDGQKLAVIASDNTFNLWVIDTGELLKTPQYNAKERISSVAFSSDGQTLAIARNTSRNTKGQNSIQLFDVQGNLLKPLPVQMPVQSPRPIRDMRFSPDGKKLAVITFGDSTATLWDLSTQTEIILRGHWNAISAVSFSPDSRLIATGASDGFARVWDINGNSQRVLRGHDSQVTALGFSQDGTELTTVTSLGTVRLWDVPPRACTERDPFCTIFRIPNQGMGTFQALTDVAFSGDGQLMAMADRNGKAYLWKVGQPEVTLLKSFKGGSADGFRTRARVFLSPDGQRLATIATDGTARLWTIPNEGSNRLISGGANEAVVAIDMAANPPQFATVSKDGTLSLQNFYGNVPRKFKVPNFAAETGILRSAVFSPDGQMIATVSGKDNIPRLWNLQGRLLAEVNTQSSQVSSLSFSPNGQKLAVSFLDGTVDVVNLRGRSLLPQPIQNGSSVINAQFSPDGQALVTASFDSRARIWNLQGAKLGEYRSETGLWSVSFSPDGQQIVAVGWGDKGWLWAVSDLDQLLDRGCNWMQDYLASHPEEAKELTVCQGESSRGESGKGESR